MSKVAVILGVGPGIGLAVAKRFAKEGFKVALLARSKDKLEKYKSEVNSSVGIPVDISNKEALQKALEKVEAEVGPIDVLVYNAFVWKQKKFVDLTLEDLKESFDLHMASLFNSIKFVHPSMKQRKSGTILVTGGGFAFQGYPGTTYLSTAKAYQRNFVQCVAPELKEDGIFLGTVTVCGIVKAEDPKFNPTLIAESFWKLYSERKEHEIVFK